MSWLLELSEIVIRFSLLLGSPDMYPPPIQEAKARFEVRTFSKLECGKEGTRGVTDDPFLKTKGDSCPFFFYSEIRKYRSQKDSSLTAGQPPSPYWLDGQGRITPLPNMASGAFLQVFQDRKVSVCNCHRKPMASIPSSLFIERYRDMSFSIKKPGNISEFNGRELKQREFSLPYMDFLTPESTYHRGMWDAIFTGYLASRITFFVKLLDKLPIILGQFLLWIAMPDADPTPSESRHDIRRGNIESPRKSRTRVTVGIQTDEKTPFWFRKTMVGSTRMMDYNTFSHGALSMEGFIWLEAVDRSNDLQPRLF